MRIGTVKQIWRFAVKSMAGEQLSSCIVGMRGIPGDRGWAVRDETAGKLATGSRHPLLMRCAARYREQPTNGSVHHVDLQFPDGMTVGSDAADVNARLSDLLGKSVSLSPLQLDRGAEHYFDVAPVHVLTTAALTEMARLNDKSDWDVRRFRPNFFVETEPGIEGLIEFEWSGRTLRLGEVEVYCEMPCERCAMANHAQAELPKDESVLRTIAKEANMNLGTYARVVRPGEVRVNDVVEVI
jgi:uncharacterized protein YcbX